MIKKKILMMAMATSMILPSNLALVANVTIPVLAQEGDHLDPFNGELGTPKTENINNKEYKVYTLTESKTLSNQVAILEDEKVKINLNTNTLTLNVTNKVDNKFLDNIVVKDGADLIIENGDLVFNSGRRGIVIQGTGNLTMDKVTMNYSKVKEFYGIGVIPVDKNDYASSKIEIKNSILDGRGGNYTAVLTVNGNIQDQTQCPTIDFENVEMYGKDAGIYQAGYSEITVKNCTIEATTEFGIETRAGKLEVNNSKIIGGMNDPKVVPAPSASSTYNTALAVAQHSTKLPIDVTVNNSDLSGGAAFLVANPENNSEYNVNITLNNAWLQGKTYDLGYTNNIATMLNNSVNLNGNIYENEKTVVFEKEDATTPNKKYKYEKIHGGASISDLTQTDRFQYTPKTQLTENDLILAEGPYTVSNNLHTPDVSVRGLKKDQDFELEYEFVEDNTTHNITSGTVNVIGKGNYQGWNCSKTYIILDDRGTTVNIVINGTDPSEEVKLDIPIECFNPQYVDANKNLISEVTNDAIADALTTQSGNSQYNDTDLAPNYTYQVSGFENSSELEEPKVEIQLQEKSMICLALNLVSNLETAIVNSDEMMEVSEVSMLSDEEIVLEDSQTRSNKTLIYASIKDLDTDSKQKGLITRKEVEAYLKNLPSYEKAQLNDDFENIVYKDSWLNLGDSNINLDENGFLVIKAEVQPVSKPSKPSTGGGGGGSTAQKPKPEEPMTPVVGTPTSMYRLYNRLTGEHLYTMDKDERDHLLTSDTWQDEGEGWIAPSVSDYPVYRLLNPNTSDHHYTIDKNEFDTLPSLGWVAEGVAFFSADKDDENNVVLYRLYNPNAEGAGIHHYTTDEKERDTLVSLGWKYEGLAWAGMKAE